MNKNKTFKELLGYDLLCSETCECPYCKSKKYTIVDQEVITIVRCDDCKKLWVSD